TAPPDPNPPSEKPKLAITTQGGNALLGDKIIEGTIDVANVGCDILVDAGPTSWGTCRANAQGHWSKTCHFDTTGTWTITAHSSNAAGKTDRNPVIFQVSSSVDPGPDPGPPGTDAPPEPVSEVNADKT